MSHVLPAFRVSALWLGFLLYASVVSIALAAGVEGVAIAWALAPLLLVWWFSGARDGRRLSEALVGAVTIAVLANFLSSWFGLFAGLPLGAVIRDVAFAVLILAAVDDRPRLPISSGRALAYVGLVAVVLVSFHGSPRLTDLVGARTYLLYPLLLLPGASQLGADRRRGTGRALLWVVLALAIVGLGEAATDGRLLSDLGFRPDYAETTNLAASPYFHDMRRATGGLGNFLEFGLVMSFGLVLTRAFLRGPTRFVVSGFLLAAAFFSWSRLAWVLALLVMVAPIDSIRNGRPSMSFSRLVAGGAVVLAAVSLVVAFGPRETVTNRIFARDRVTQRSDLTRSQQLHEALHVGGRSLTGAGAGTQGSAADRSGTQGGRIVTDNSYLIWLLELGWLGVAALLLLSAAVVRALWTVRAWWALAIAGALAFANALFAASDSRVVLVVAFAAMRVLWVPPPTIERSPRSGASSVRPATEPGR